MITVRHKCYWAVSCSLTQTKAVDRSNFRCACARPANALEFGNPQMDSSVKQAALDSFLPDFAINMLLYIGIQ